MIVAYRLKLRARADQNYGRDGYMSEGIAKQKIKRKRAMNICEIIGEFQKLLLEKYHG
ncbi:6941_t:CDS:1, partial [Ambispora gerdemannii]